MGRQCTKFHFYRTQHEQVIGINNIHKFTLPEAVCCCLQTCNVYILILKMGYICAQSFIILSICIATLVRTRFWSVS